MARRARPPLALVARSYEAAAEAGEPPTQAVRDRFGVAKSTAEGWVAQARSAGLLKPASKGARTARNAKAVAVARALNVPYEDLVGAVRLHAGGSLRVGRGDVGTSTPPDRPTST